MARLLIVSRSMALGMRLADQHEVDERSADELGDVLPEVDADVLVLDVGDPVLAVNTVNSLREAEQATPVLLVSGYQPEWEQVEAQQVEGVHVVPLPITRIALLEGIAILTGKDSSDLLGQINLTGSRSSSAAGAPAGVPAKTPDRASNPSQPQQTAPAAPAASPAAAFPVVKPAPVAKPAQAAKPSPGAKPAPAAKPSSTAKPSSAAEGSPTAKPSPAAKPSSTVKPPPAPVAKASPADAAAARAVRAVAQAAAQSAETSAAAAAAAPAASEPEPAVETWESVTRPATLPNGKPAQRTNQRPQHDRQTVQQVNLDRQKAQLGTAGPTVQSPTTAAAGITRPTAAGGPTASTGAAAGAVPPPAASPAARGTTAKGRTGALPTGEVPQVTESGVNGLSYSASITRPFDQHPPTGQFPLNYPPTRQPSSPQRWLGTSALPDPDAPRPGYSSQAPQGPQTPRPPSNYVDTPATGRLQRLGNRPRKMQRRPSTGDPRTPPGTGLVTDPLGPRTDPYGFPVSALDRRLDAEAAALVTTRSAAADGGIVLRTGDLVRMLHDRVGDLYGVSDTAQVLADDVIERADADAAAILVPDGPVWRVNGGVGLRPLERRLVLEDSHWLITEIGSAGRAVLIEDTDIIRQQLSGAPLAAWRHLLAVPVPDVRAIVVLARGREGGPFSDRDLSAVISPVREAAALLAQAVETRRLARMLSPLREAESDSERRASS
jgi:hypothetical protein